MTQGKAPGGHHGGDRTVAPKKKRNRKGRASEARRLVQRIEAASAELRQESTINREGVAIRLDRMHADKRSMRRDIFNAKPDLEGSRVYRGQPGAGA